MSIYERELLAIVYAVQKWGAYLSHEHFIIKTDQKSIKFMLEQRLNTPFQQVWMSKLIGFDFVIQYKEGVENLAADALFRKPGVELLPMMLNNAKDGLLEQIKLNWSTDNIIQLLIKKLMQNPNMHPKYSWHKGELRRKGKLVIGANSDLKHLILKWLHDSPVGGHSGRDVTAARVKSLFSKKVFSRTSSSISEIVIFVNDANLIWLLPLVSSSPFPSLTDYGMKLAWISLKASHLPMANRCFLWWWIDSVSMLTFLLCHIPILLWMLLNYFWTISSNYMAFLVLLLVTETLFSLARSGLNFSSSKGFL